MLAGCPGADNQQSTTFRYQMGPPAKGSLHEAVMLGNTPGVKKFIAEKQSREALEEEQEGFTPLHYAVYYGRTVIAQLLIDASVNLEQGDQEGATALHWSIKTDYDGLLNTNSSRKASLSARVLPDFDAITKLLLDKGAKVNATDKQGRSPLHEAARKDRLKAAELLIDRRANINLPDNQGRTPLHDAVLNSKTRITKVLIAKGANPDIKDKSGKSARQYAREQKQEKILDSLTRVNAKPAYSFAFDVESHKAQYKSGGTYTRAVIEANKPTGDTRAIKYTSSENKIATIDNKGVVTFVTPGTVTITASKALKGEYPKATASYILYITMKPIDRTALIDEIDRAIKAHGDKVNLNYIDTSGITDMSGIFSISETHGTGFYTFNGDISKWDVAEVTNMFSMFERARAFNQDISEWTVSKVTRMDSMFDGATSFNQDISEWTVSKVTRMDSMFDGASAFNQDISEWTVSKVTRMDSMFDGATSFNQDISEWDVSKVTRMDFMFNGATSFNQDISEWDVSKFTRMGHMFENAKEFNQNLNAWRTKINNKLKDDDWLLTRRMFRGSGLADSLPSWCNTVSACRAVQ